MHSDETHALTCGIVAIMFPCRIHHAKKGFRIELQLHFEVDASCDGSNANSMISHNASIKMDENDALCTYFLTQLRLFFKDM